MDSQMKLPSSDLLANAIKETFNESDLLSTKIKKQCQQKRLYSRELPDLNDEREEDKYSQSEKKCYPISKIQPNSSNVNFEGSVVIPKESNVFLLSSFLKSNNSTESSSITNVIDSQSSSASSSNDQLKKNLAPTSTGNKYLKPNQSIIPIKQQPLKPLQMMNTSSCHSNIINQANLKDNSKSISFIGSVMVNKDKLFANANKSSSSIKIGNATALLQNIDITKTVSKSNHENNRIQLRQQQQQLQKENNVNNLKDEVNSLLKRKSNHIDEAENEWFKKHNERMDKMIKKEHYLNLESQIESTMVRAFQCTDIECINLKLPITEKIRMTCYEKKHIVKTVSVLKRFFICGSCHRRNIGMTLGQSKLALPLYDCVCGVQNWKSCGRKSIGGENDALNPAMVLTASEFSSRQDIQRVKVMASDLHG